MGQIMNYPLLIGVITVLCLWASARVGASLRKRTKRPDESLAEEYAIVLGATLTLLGLLIGFSFSMAINRYDLRKNYEEEEANAIGTEYLRADLLADPVRQRVQQDLRQYLDLRIRRYQAHASHDVSELSAKTAQLQAQLWVEVKDAARANPNAIMAAVATGMNDVINRQGFTQAARLNRIPLPGWGLMAIIALFSNFLIGYGEKGARNYLLVIVPLVIAVSFLLIADIESPQGGFIRIVPHNLMNLADSLRTG